MKSGSLSPLLSYVNVGCQKLHVEVLPLYVNSREEHLFPDVPNHQRERFLKKGLRAAEELSLAWNNQKAVPELQGGIVKKVQNVQWVRKTKRAVRKRRAGRLQRARRGEEGSGATRSGPVKCFESEEVKLGLNM